MQCLLNAFLHTYSSCFKLQHHSHCSLLRSAWAADHRCTYNVNAARHAASTCPTFDLEPDTDRPTARLGCLQPTLRSIQIYSWLACLAECRLLLSEFITVFYYLVYFDRLMRVVWWVGVGACAVRVATSDVRSQAGSRAMLAS